MKCIVIQTRLEIKMTKLRVKGDVWHGIISELYPFLKSKIWSNPYREPVTLKSTLAWDFGEIEDRAKISTEPIFREIVK